jgi:hypothetical protein
MNEISNRTYFLSGDKWIEKKIEKNPKLIGVPHHAEGHDSKTQIKYCKSRITNQEFINWELRQTCC